MSSTIATNIDYIKLLMSKFMEVDKPLFYRGRWWVISKDREQFSFANNDKKCLTVSGINDLDFIPDESL
jgi:hypothetical protein